MIYLSNQNIIESIDNQVFRGGVPPLVIDYIVVGGGGGGRGYQGGGAGGFVTGSLIAAFNVPFIITVGAGGLANLDGPYATGSLSSFSGNNFGTPINIIASGGFTSDAYSGYPQHNAGGLGNGCAGGGRYYGGGGGGGMRAGYDATCATDSAGGGGDAIAWYSGSFAGGGGGGTIGLAGETPQGGLGGGSTNGRSGANGGSFTSPGLPPVQNSGGGGGGVGNNSQTYPATNGASGSVLIRYPYVPGDFGIPYATGGDMYLFSDYVYHRFNSDGVFATFAR